MIYSRLTESVVSFHLVSGLYLTAMNSAQSGFIGLPSVSRLFLTLRICLLLHSMHGAWMPNKLILV